MRFEQRLDVLQQSYRCKRIDAELVETQASLVHRSEVEDITKAIAQRAIHRRGWFVTPCPAVQRKDRQIAVEPALAHALPRNFAGRGLCHRSRCDQGDGV